MTAATTTTLAWSSELMTNFRQADVVAAESLFQALQTDDGRSILLSIGTDGALGAITESPGEPTGWVRLDLTAGLRTGGATASTFAAGQNHATGTIDLMLVMTAGGEDELHVSLGNSATDLSWLSAPSWTAIPYDDPARARTAIVEVFVSDAADGEYLVVDVLRDPGTTEGYLFRYYIDPAHADPARALTRRAWNGHDLAEDMRAVAAGSAAERPLLASCLGRRAIDRVDGTYTLGTVGTATQLLYQCLYNPFNPAVPAPAVRLQPPPDATGMAAVRMQGDATDLYVVGGRTLYRYAADAQADGATCVALLSSDVFERATQLHALADANRVVVWGHSRAGRLFSTWCPIGNLSDAAAWSVPLPLLAGVEQISPYLNRKDGGNTFFAHTGGNQLTKLVQDPRSTSWIRQEILLPAPADTSATPFTSYTTHLHLGTAGAAVQLSAARRVAVTVNQHYLVLDPTPIPVTADRAGNIAVVEPAQGLRGTALTVATEDGTAVTINPMDAPMARAGALGSPDRLAHEPIVDDRGAQRPLLPADTSERDCRAIAQATQGLSTAYTSLSAPRPAAPDAATPAAVTVGSVGVGAPPTAAAPLSPESFATAVEAAAGDVLQFLADAADYVVHIVEDAATGVWHFVCEIAGETLRFALDSTEKVIGALEHVFKAITAAIDDIIDYLKMIFSWADITRTKDVLKNLFLLNMRHGVAHFAGVKRDLRDALAGIKSTIDALAAIEPDQWQPTLDGQSKPLTAVPAGVDHGKVMSSPGNVFGHHVAANIAGARPVAGQPSGQQPPPGPDDGVLRQLVDKVAAALQDETGVFREAVDRITTTLLDGDAYATMSLKDVAVKLAAIVIDTALDTAEVFLDLLIDVLVVIATAIIDAIAEPIWIPVVSDMLAHFGITIAVSMLDVVGYVAAVPVTTVYHLMVGHAPFRADDGFSDMIINATDLESLVGPMPALAGAVAGGGAA